MNIYRISVWGPCKNEGEVFARKSGEPDSKAIVVAPSIDVANQVCYLVSTRDAHGQSNYQEIDSFSPGVACILDTTEDPICFEPDTVNDLVVDPILPPLIDPDTATDDGCLFFARCIEIAHVTDTTGTTRGQFWVYASDAASANTVATQHGYSVGLFDLDEDAIRVELFPMEKTCVFWNVGMIVYGLHNKTAGGDA